MVALRPVGLILLALARPTLGERQTVRAHASAEVHASVAPARSVGLHGKRRAAVGVLLAGAASADSQVSNPAARELFEQLDKNKDGRIDFDEYMDSARVALDKIHTEGALKDKRLAVYQEVYKRADLDRDGFLNERECEYLQYLTVEVVRASAGGPDDLERDELGIPSFDDLFQLFDIDADGQISAEEWQQAVVGSAEEWGWDPADAELLAWVDEVFAKATVRGAGAMSLREMQYGSYLVNEAAVSGRFRERGLVSRMFKHLDTNKDGSIDAQEVEAVAANVEHAPAGGGEHIAHTVRNNFAVADADGDGRLDRKEAEALSRRLFGELAAGEEF